MTFFKFVSLFGLITLSLFSSLLAQGWVSYQSQQQINDLVETDTELLMATDAGLVVINKLTLEKTIFNQANSNLRNNHIPAITQAPNGNFWIGTYDVILQRFDGSNFDDPIVPLHPEYNASATKLYDLKIAPNGDLWVGTTDGVFQQQDQNWAFYGQEELGPTFFEAWDIAINDEGDVFVASFDVHQLSNGTWSNLTEGTQVHGYLHGSLFFSQSGDLFFAGDLEEIGRYDGVQWQAHPHGLNGSQIKGFTEDVNGNLYFFSQYDGIFQLTNDLWTQQNDAQTSAFENNISYFYIDAQDRRWLNKNIHLSVNANESIQSTLISLYTLPNDNVITLKKGSNGAMYFITGDRENISVVDTEGNWSFLPLPTAALPFEQFNDLLVLADNDIWLASNEGLYHYSGADWQFIDLEACKSFAVNTQGKIYLSAADRIYLIDNEEITEYNTNNSPITSLIISGHGLDANDHLWISAFSWEGDNVLQSVSPSGIWTTFSGSEYPALNNRPQGDFHFTSDGQMWMPTDLVGAIKFDGTTFTNPFVGNLGEVDNYNVYSIESDATGKMYFAHDYGITSLLDGEWENLLIDELPENINTNTTIQFDDEGILWWGNNRHGVFTYTPSPTTSTIEATLLDTQFSLYPNPAHTFTRVDFTLAATAEVKIQVINALGQLTAHLPLGQLSAGSFQETIQVGDWPKGLYFIQVQVEESVTTTTLMVH